MNPTLFSAFLRQRLTSPPRLVLLFLIFTFPLAMVAATHGGLGFGPLGTASMFTFVLGAGMIGGDASSGVFQLLFARPVTRFSYLLSRWLAVAAGAAVLNAIQVSLAALVMASNRALEGWPAVATFIGEQSLEALALAAVIAAFSGVLPGIGDVVAIFASNLVLTMVKTVASFARQEGLARAVAEVERTLSPDVSFAQMFAGGEVAWRPIVMLVSSVVIGLALAALALERREISYASD